MLKTKHLHAYYENYGKLNQTYLDIDDAVNKFLEENNITENELIDIKYAPIGSFEGQSGGWEASVLVIYKVK